MRALRRALAAFAGLAIAFMVVSAVVAAGDLGATDRAVAATMAGLWRGWLEVPARALAVLGGLEVTAVVCAGLAVYLYRLRFRAEAWALLAYPLVNAVELVYKHVVFHPGPSGSMVHPDGPSLSELFEAAQGTSSFPSGHMARSVFAYGLLGFVVFRMAERRWLRRAVVLGAVLVSVLMAVDRLYLGVHWESDVLGGTLLGAVALSGAIIWLDRPRGGPRQ